MKVSYRRGMQKNFMLIDPEDLAWDNYECRMLLNNNIEGLLKLRIRPMAGGVLFYYDITSKQPLNRLLKGTQWKAEELKSFMIQICGVFTRIENFLLKEPRILLDPDLIYVEPESGRLSLCYVPGLERPFYDDLGNLLEGLLESIDHRDRECVVLAYGLYQETRKENYGTDDLMRQIYREADITEGTEKSGNFVLTVPEILDEHPEEERKKGGLLERLRDRVFSHLPEPEDEAEEEEDLWFDGSGLTGSEKKPVCKETDKEPAEEDDKRDIFDEEEPLYREERALKKGDTTALSELRKEINMHSLKALDAGVSDIFLAYYPFIIGKQENLVDYRLEDDTVSRLHLKIEREDDTYTIEDLNSTNGTTLNGELLENNEKRRIVPGDQIGIARLCFRFE